MNKKTIALIGAGNMGSSLLAGLIKNGFSPEELRVCDPDVDKLQLLHREYNVFTTTHHEEVVKEADIVILAVKPHIMRTVLESIASIVQQKKSCLISVAAGIPEKNIQSWVGGNIAIIRCMPNTPALIGAGASALYANTFVNKNQHDYAETILRAVGMVVWVNDETEMDAVTALSGSGPAYFFLVIETLQAIGEELGLSKDISRLLTLQTAYGAACMALDSTESVSELRRRVTSPGGTTEAAIQVFIDEKLPDIFKKALKAAHSRSKELGSK
jgi:pyrroline-5-carboxylate reductase